MKRRSFIKTILGTTGALTIYPPALLEKTKLISLKVTGLKSSDRVVVVARSTKNIWKKVAEGSEVTFDIPTYSQDQDIKVRVRDKAEGIKPFEIHTKINKEIEKKTINTIRTPNE